MLLKSYWVKLFLSVLNPSSKIIIGFWMADPPTNQKAGLEIWFEFFWRKNDSKRKKTSNSSSLHITYINYWIVCLDFLSWKFHSVWWKDSFEFRNLNAYYMLRNKPQACMAQLTFAVQAMVTSLNHTDQRNKNKNWISIRQNYNFDM